MTEKDNFKLSFTSKTCINDIKSKIQLAKYSIDIEIYYFNPDNTGTEILNLLKSKSLEGVKIRLLLDHIGSYRFDKISIKKDLDKHGIQIRFFNSIIPFSKGRKSILFLRNHRRSIIIDDKYLFTGGICFADPAIHWLETMISIQDKKTVEKAQKIFNNTWNRVYYPTFKMGKINKKDLNNQGDFTYLTQAPLQFQRYIYKYYLNSIKYSKERIFLISPYFIPDAKIVRYLKKASMRGVEVNIITPIKSNWTIADIARNTYIKSILQSNIKIHFTEKMIHGKFAIFDDQTAFIGTMNLDNLSLKYNYESGIIIKNKKCIDNLMTYTENLKTKTFNIDLNTWNNRNILLKIIEKIVWVFRKIL